MSRLCPILLMAWTAWSLVGGSVSAADPRYLAVFADGKRVEGTRIVQWHDNGATPKLDSTPLSGGNVPLRWLRDLSLEDDPRSLNAGFVETIGGDRLPGRVVGFEPGRSSYLPDVHPLPCLLVQPSVTLHFPLKAPLEQVRVLVRDVARVVWGASRQRALQPGTLFYRDGRVLKFRGLRWEPAAVQVLLDDGPRRVEMAELSEVHLARSDPWEAYYRELAVLAPDGTARLVRLETNDGVILTGSQQRMRAATIGSDSDSNTWFHMVQPAWSLDPLWLRFSTIRDRLTFAPHEVPLIRLRPSEVVERPLLGGGWHWRVNQNVQGGMLRSAGLYHGWGLGMHAFCQLTYDLPQAARAFQSKVGLDQVAGSGGCARARVRVGKADGEPLYQSPHLIGSSQGASTGNLTLAPPPAGPFRLILEADPAHDDRPAGADPLDIRDALNWLEPMLLLDEAQVAAEVQRRLPEDIPAWSGWTVASQGNEPAVELANVWVAEGDLPWTYAIGARAPGGRLTLARKLEVPREDDWLVVAVRRAANDPMTRIAVRIDGEQVLEAEVPAGAPGSVDPIVIPVAAYHNRTIEVELEQMHEGQPAPVFWSAITLQPELPSLARLFEDRPVGFDPMPVAGGPVELSPADPYSGTVSLKLQKAADGVHLGPLKLPIRERPMLGEFRYMRFALRMNGNVRACLELGHAGRVDRPLRYDAGIGPPARERAIRVNNSVPPEWVVITRDLYTDFGAFDLTDLTLSTVGDGPCLVDHVYLARSANDFNQIGAQGKLTPEQALARAAVADFQGALDAAQRAMVLVNVEGQWGTGVLIDAQGRIATTGYAAVGPDRPVEVILHDGRKVKGKTRGLSRDLDAALIQLDDAGPWPHAEPGNWDPAQGGRLLALAYLGNPQDGKVGAAIVHCHGAESGAVWISLAFERTFSGGPLVDREGKLVGLHSRPFGPGGTIALTMNGWNQVQGRMVAGEVWGNWPASLAPLVGFYAAISAGKLQVVAVRPGSPAAAAGVRVGDEIKQAGGQDVPRLQDLLRVVSGKMPGEKLSLALMREGQSVMSEILLERR